MSGATLEPVPPFDFGLSLRFAEGFRPGSGEQVIDGGRLWKAFRVLGSTVATRVESSGGVGADLTEPPRAPPDWFGNAGVRW